MPPASRSSGDVLVDGPPGVGDGGARRRDGFDDRGHGDRRRALERAHVGPTHAARADQSEAEHALAHRPRLARYSRFARWSAAARSNRSLVRGSVSCSTTSHPR